MHRFFASLRMTIMFDDSIDQSALRTGWYCGSPDRSHQERDADRDQHSLLQDGHVVSMGKEHVGDRHSPEMNLSNESLQPVRSRRAGGNPRRDRREKTWNLFQICGIRVTTFDGQLSFFGQHPCHDQQRHRHQREQRSAWRHQDGYSRRQQPSPEVERVTHEAIRPIGNHSL